MLDSFSLFHWLTQPHSTLEYTGSVLPPTISNYEAGCSFGACVACFYPACLNTPSNQLNCCKQKKKGELLTTMQRGIFAWSDMIVLDFCPQYNKLYVCLPSKHVHAVAKVALRFYANLIGQIVFLHNLVSLLLMSYHPRMWYFDVWLLLVCKWT